MKLYINGEERTEWGDDCLTVSGLVQQLSEEWLSKGEMVSEVRVDGDVFLWMQSHKDLKHCSVIEVATRDTKAFLVSALIEACRESASVLERLTRVADGLCTPQHQDALRSFLECANTIEWLYSVLSGVQRVMGVSFADASLAENFARHLDALKVILSGIHGALQEENYVLLSDVIRYELVPCVTELQSFLSLLVKEADRKMAALS